MRRIALIPLVLAVLVPASGLAAAPKFALPPKAAQGQLMTVNVAVKSGVRCYLTVRYADNAAESPVGVYAKRGHAVWRWRVAPTAALGTARATVACGRAGTSSRTFSVVGSLSVPKVVVEKQGFSQRNLYLGDSTVSYGLLLRNPSGQQDALNTFVLINFVDAANRILGTASSTVSAIAAGSVYALGNQIQLRTQTPVARLEITIQPKTARPRTNPLLPALQNVFVAPSKFEAGWVGEVDGELVNESQTRTLLNADISVVVLDAAGQVVGGGTGMAFTSVPPGSRSAFLAQMGFNSIPTTRAASAVVSISPTYSG